MGYIWGKTNFEKLIQKSSLMLLWWFECEKMDLTAEIKISENVLSLFGALYAFQKPLKLDTHRFCVPSMNAWLKFRIPWIFALKQVHTEQLMLSTWLRSAILYVSHVNVSSSLSWSVFHFSTVLAITALFFTTLLAASTLSARLFVPDIAAGSARTFSPTNSHMVVHVTLLSGYCPMTDRYHKPWNKLAMLLSIAENLNPGASPLSDFNRYPIVLLLSEVQWMHGNAHCVDSWVCLS